MSKYTVTTQATAITKEFEGFRSKAYQDGGGIWTIGYGTVTFPDGHSVKPGDTITQADATTALVAGMQQRLDFVSPHINVVLDQNEVDAIADFVYNIGTGNFLGSTFLKLLNASDFHGAAEEFGKWIHDHAGNVEPGLVRRRAYEKDLFLTPESVTWNVPAFDSSLDGLNNA